MVNQGNEHGLKSTMFSEMWLIHLTAVYIFNMNVIGNREPNVMISQNLAGFIIGYIEIPQTFFAFLMKTAIKLANKIVLKLVLCTSVTNLKISGLDTQKKILGTRESRKSK